MLREVSVLPLIALGLFAAIVAFPFCSAGEWLAEEIVDPADSTEQLTSQESHWCIDVDGLGRVHVAWEDWRSIEDSEIRYSSRLPGIGWSTETFRVNQGGTYAQNPTVCSDDNGNVFVAWQDERSTHGVFEVWYRMYSVTTGWDSVEAVLDNPSDRSAHAPSAAMDDEGNVHVVWLRETTPPNNKLLYKKYNPATGWSNAVTLSVGVAGVSEHPVILEESGTLHVVWSQYTLAEGRCIYYRRYSPGVGWDSVATKVSDTYTGTDPSIAVDPEGNIHVVWTVWFSDLEQEVAYRRWTPGTGWGADVFYVTENDSIPSMYPTVACDGAGCVHVIWQDYVPGGYTTLYERIYCPDSGWGEITAPVGEGWQTDRAHLKADICGNLHLVWSDCRAGCCMLYYSEWDAATSSVISEEEISSPLCKPIVVVVPNPSRGAMEIRYTNSLSGISGDVTVRVYDVLGHLLCRLPIEETSSGGVARWDGCDRSGRPVAPGTYFCVISADNHVTTHKIVLER